jgi:branched-chain amino acid transport system permease protein
MAGVMGVNYQSISAITFGIAAALGGIAGVLYGLTELVNPYSGMMLTIKGLTVAVLGGLGSFYGALLAGFVLGLAESFGVLFVSAAYKDLIGFVILIVILLLSPGGLSRKEFYTPT